ncbi:proline--tRNA ligase [Pseudodesulfovibrio piezophilus]|uniref:Proline--tRNA ligase n=1 Tax=Pseudodesulfovibrio piezophilus (strain DSM 21447 / JCM 15486 / C1TLV30) TaxID=1322246 RepID=M1WVS9_PSEP2|nr:proline--tRNA ligase [Pseudodesulfovibrio piezophilus]CCH48718.1 Prolyl-tRNA synthetase [Pseudodesulfovibrio piezophilus C1TLV30]
MRLSRYYAPTLKEDPADAEVVSHKLLMRAGMIRKLTSGIYNYLPLGLRSINKVARIIREEMDRAGAMEVLLPMVQPADLWRETGRWDYYGKELLRLNDRNGRDYCLGPTHEEVITDLVRGEIKSYKQLPINLYQIQTKFRDEIRPRFGLMRGREFIMKDAYSFDKDEAGAEASYWAMFEAYKAAFARIGLRFKPVQADSGAIGGDFSHEFMVLADTGEDTIASCKSCEFGANLEKARVVLPEGTPNASGTPCPEIEARATPGAKTIEEVCTFLSVEPQKLIKSLLLTIDGEETVLALVRGDRELNDIKLRNLVGGNEIEMADEATVQEKTGAPVGFAGPVGLPEGLRIFADQELCTGTDWVVGANKADTHLLHVSLERDCTIEQFADLRVIEETDPCPECGGEVEFTKGIEVGHVFKLGLKYSEKMEATFLDENGKSKHMIMGCYGIGVSRIVASAIEQNHDENGCCFPPSIAPFEVALISLGGKDQDVADKAEELYTEIMKMGIDACYDDRKERPGVKFADADLVGYPMQLVLGGKGLKNGIIEAKDRKTGEKSELPLEGFAEAFVAWRKKIWSQWGLDL